jgi:hypothetical protein
MDKAVFCIAQLSTGQKADQPEEIGESIEGVQEKMADEIEAVAEDRFEGALQGFLKGIGC